jgi:hypothetical protein
MAPSDRLCRGRKFRDDTGRSVMRLWGVLFAGAPIAVVPFLLLAFGFGERWPSLAYFAFGMPAWLKLRIADPVAAVACGACSPGTHHAVLARLAVAFWSLIFATVATRLVRMRGRATRAQRST